MQNIENPKPKASQTVLERQHGGNPNSDDMSTIGSTSAKVEMFKIRAIGHCKQKKQVPTVTFPLTLVVGRGTLQGCKEKPAGSKDVPSLEHNEAV